ncbi:flagellar biosynthetic protein FliR [Xanthobacter agilis]|uniref:flagellar biosynthetic protein FliR n=1 Tax=Xanthobacter agilis TaxID=47492 RepID=UPI001EFF6713|nr:flagellar biosynthetic protein FliR [Xanthobacter agilis]
MNEAASLAVLVAMLVFCRIGACLMLLPGLGGRNVPMQVRLFIAVALSLAFVPIVYGVVAAKVEHATIARLAGAIVAELLTGALLGFLVRIYIAALETLMNFAAQAIGLAGIAGMSVDDVSLPSLATLFSFSAIALIFIGDLHLELVRGLLDSYRRLPPGELFGFGAALASVVDQFTESFLVALRVASPFVLYSIGMNLAVGLINKFTPQIAVYFIATPFIMAGGLLLLYLGMSQFLSLFVMALGNWLRTH